MRSFFAALMPPNLPLIFPIPTLSSDSPATPPCPLQVYTCLPRTDTRPPDDSSLVAPSSTTLVLSSPADPPIAIRKGICSSHNPHPIYTFLSYHCLSSPYFSFISALSSVSLPNTIHDMRPSLIWAGNRQWLKKWMLCILLAHGT